MTLVEEFELYYNPILEKELENELRLLLREAERFLEYKLGDNIDSN